MNIFNKGEILTTEQVEQIVRLSSIDIDIFIFRTKLHYLKYLIQHPNIFIFPFFTGKISAFYIGSMCPNIIPCKIYFFEFAHKRDRTITSTEQLKIMMIFILLHEIKHHEQFRRLGLWRMIANRSRYEIEANEYARDFIAKHLKEFSNMLGYDIEYVEFKNVKKN
ncbi:hypothetical protein [Candidatus Clostridium stratigraminis]|uniref:Uncharacterized protein n=1 Tax=Candidatus Clostridium stratigraminis TaxID=3381661 RepID=A0ABW8T2F3_9CLOT